MGWLPDYPDFRDYTIDRDEVSSSLIQLGEKKSVKAMLTNVGLKEPEKVSIPTKTDLIGWCPPVETQGNLGSCTANAGVCLIEYYQRRALGKHIDASRLFLYKVTRNLLHWTGDTGAFIRTTMGALVLFGVPPEEYWPYEIDNFDEEPSAFCYSFAQDYQTIQYYRLDPPGTTKDSLLKRIKALLTASMPSMFGFTVYSSIDQARVDGKIPLPSKGEKRKGGHAVVAVGFDDKEKIKNRSSGEETLGAFHIRNSWGPDWGEDGYGWLPYEYVMKGLAIDWWSLLKNEWIDTEVFTIK